MSDGNDPKKAGSMFNPDNASPLVKWVIGQDSTVVVLIAFIALLTYSANRVVTELVPAHLRQIQEGYMEVVHEQSETVSTLTDAFTKEQERAEQRYQSIDARYEKTLERLSGADKAE